MLAFQSYFKYQTVPLPTRYIHGQVVRLFAPSSQSQPSRGSSAKPTWISHHSYMNIGCAFAETMYDSLCATRLSRHEVYRQAWKALVTEGGQSLMLSLVDQAQELRAILEVFVQPE